MDGRIEWVGGIIFSRMLVTQVDGVAEARPHVVWLGADGSLVGVETVTFETLAQGATLALRRAFANPNLSNPTHIRVASDELAAILEHEDLGVEVVRAPTPEIDRALEDVLKGSSFGAATYLAADASADDVGAMFHGAAELFRAVPNLPQMTTMALDIPAMDLHECVLIVGERVVAIFIDPNEVGRFVAGEAANRLHLEYVRGAELDGALRKEIAQHGWEVADATSFPSLVATEGTSERMLTKREMRIVEALGLAFAKIKPDAWARWFVRSMIVDTHEGPLEVCLSCPYTPNILNNLAMVEATIPFDHNTRRELEAVMFENIALHTGQHPRPFKFARRLLERAATTLQATFATLSPRELDALLDELEGEELAKTLDDLHVLYEYFDVHAHLYGALTHLRMIKRRSTR